MKAYQINIPRTGVGMGFVTVERKREPRSCRVQSLLGIPSR
jgi:hypothetical protein